MRHAIFLSTSATALPILCLTLPFKRCLLKKVPTQRTIIRWHFTARDVKKDNWIFAQRNIRLESRYAWMPLFASDLFPEESNSSQQPLWPTSQSQFLQSRCCPVFTSRLLLLLKFSREDRGSAQNRVFGPSTCHTRPLNP